MPEILTESFCERCGTRYTFESARPKVRLKGVKVLSLGLKNFVLSDDTSLDEAMAAARSEADREVTAHQLDAFHKTFNFCLSCRQYTCPNCWNEVEARCLSCAPHLGDELAPLALPGLAAMTRSSLVAQPVANGANGHTHHEDETEAEAVSAAESEGLASEPSAAWSAETEAARTEEPEAGIAERLAALAEPVAPVEEPIAAGEPAIGEPSGKAARQTAGLLQRFRPGQNLDDELAAFERERLEAAAAASATVAEPDLVLADPATDAEESIAAATEEPVVTAAEEPVALALIETHAEPEPVPAAAAGPEPEAASLAADVVEQPTWRIMAPDPEGLTAVPTAPADAIAPKPTTTPPPTAEPEWPARPEWPTAGPSGGLPFLGRPAQPQGGVEALWAASNQELATTAPVPGRSASGIQPCVSCGLSLSATARFCRRCGTLQGR